MLQMDLPHINVLTKIDNLSNYSPLPFNLDFYTEVQDLNYLLPHLEAETSRLSHEKFGALNQTIIDLVQEFALVAFETLAVEDKKSMMHLLQVIDRASGYAFGPAEGANDSIWQVAVREGWGDLNINDVQERWVDAKDEYDEHERRQLEEEAKAKESHAPQGQDAYDDDELDMRGIIPDGGTKVIRKS